VTYIHSCAHRTYSTYVDSSGRLTPSIVIFTASGRCHPSLSLKCYHCRTGCLVTDNLRSRKSWSLVNDQCCQKSRSIAGCCGHVYVAGSCCWPLSPVFHCRKLIAIAVTVIVGHSSPDQSLILSLVNVASPCRLDNGYVDDQMSDI